MVPKGKGLKIYKSMDFDEFMAEWHKLVPAQEEVPAVLHFRIATQGSKKLENCHPFLVKPGLGLAHNGTIRWAKPLNKEDDRSDSEILAQDILASLSARQLGQYPIRKLIEEAIGFSKLALLDAKGKLIIINGSLGEWHEGVWFSNTSFRPFVVTYYGAGGHNHHQRTTGTITKPRKRSRKQRKREITYRRQKDTISFTSHGYWVTAKGDDMPFFTPFSDGGKVEHTPADLWFLALEVRKKHPHIKKIYYGDVVPSSDTPILLDKERPKPNIPQWGTHTSYPCPYCKEHFKFSNMAKDPGSTIVCPKKECEEIVICPCCRGLLGEDDVSWGTCVACGTVFDHVTAAGMEA
jgi:hypothetical protein